MNRRSFFGWMAGAVATICGAKAKANEGSPKVPSQVRDVVIRIKRTQFRQKLWGFFDMPWSDSASGQSGSRIAVFTDGSFVRIPQFISVDRLHMTRYPGEDCLEGRPMWRLSWISDQPNGIPRAGLMVREGGEKQHLIGVVKYLTRAYEKHGRPKLVTIESRLRLEACALDTDGKVKPIDQLSYAPRPTQVSTDYGRTWH